jgi:glutamyl endopeptidase
MFDIEKAAEALEEAASSVDVDALDGTRALRLVQTLARVERVVAGARTVVTRRVEETRAWKRTGHRTMADWLAATNGTSLGEAIGAIETARSLEELPATEAAFRSGEISETQARAVSVAAVEDAGAERSLLDTAKTETVKTLRQRSRAVIAAATTEDDERARDARIHRERYFRRWLDGDGALCLSGRMSADAGARLFATIDAHVERLAKRAADDGVIERQDALAVDALVALADPGERTPAAVQLSVARRGSATKQARRARSPASAKCRCRRPSASWATQCSGRSSATASTSPPSPAPTAPSRLRSHKQSSPATRYATCRAATRPTTSSSTTSSPSTKAAPLPSRTSPVSATGTITSRPTRATSSGASLAPVPGTRRPEESTCGPAAGRRPRTVARVPEHSGAWDRILGGRTMRHRRVLGLLIGAAAVTAVVVPATADAEDPAPPANAVVAQALDPGAVAGQPASSAQRVGSGETSPAVAPSTEPALAGPEPAFVIGKDSRTKVKDTTKYPARAVASIHINPVQIGLGSYICTGWFISNDTLATAAHCIEYDNDGAVYTVIPGRKGNQAPFNSCTNMDGVFASNTWIAAGGVNAPIGDDYAAVDTACNFNIGSFGFKQVNDTKLQGLKEKLHGYPADLNGGSKQYKTTGKVEALNTKQAFYKNDTAGGMSGGPVFKKFNGCGVCAIAIHTTAFGTMQNPINNGGTRIYPQVGQFLNSAITNT